MLEKLFIGRNTLNGKGRFLTTKELRSHACIIGGTGRGKSRFGEHIIRRFAESKTGCVYFDPHGQTYESLVNYFAVQRMKSKIVLVDPNESAQADGYSVGLNFLQPTEKEITDIISQIMQAIFKVFGEADAETKPRLERRLRAALMALYLGGYTLGELLDFSYPANTAYRQKVLQKVEHPYVLQEWGDFDAIKKQADKENLIESVLNRACKLILSEPVKRIVSQVQSTIDWEDVIENSKIVLVNLQPLKISVECQRMLSILMIDQITNYARRRPKNKTKKAFYVLCDEAAEFAPDDLSYGLQALRKTGVYFWLFFQTLAQVKGDEKQSAFYSNLMANCDIKVVFHTSYDDAAALVGDLFAGKIRGDKVKLDITGHEVLPEESSREVRTESESESKTDGEVHTEGTVESSGHGEGHGSSMGAGSVNFYDGSGLQIDPNSISESDFSSSSDYYSDSVSSGHVESDSQVHSATSGHSTSKAIVPFYEYLISEKLSSREYFSIEEIKEKYIAWLVGQPKRHAQIKIGDEPTIPVLLPFVEELKARQADTQKLKDYSNQKYALPVAEVDKLIEQRRLMLFGETSLPTNQKVTENDSEDERWQ